MIALIGSEGSMGKRYQAILRHLQFPFLVYDTCFMSLDNILAQAKRCDRIIIATPTDTHVRYLRELLPSGKPILCEKPITKNLDEIEALHEWCNENGYTYNMVMQYKEYGLNLSSGRLSEYNYFRHGNDGLVWDCMQIIALARGPIILGEDSPEWRCVLNGRKLSIEFMDKAYVYMIAKWMRGGLDQPMAEILEIHRKVAHYAATN